MKRKNRQGARRVRFDLTLVFLLAPAALANDIGASQAAKQIEDKIIHLEKRYRDVCSGLSAFTRLRFLLDADKRRSSAQDCDTELWKSESLSILDKEYVQTLQDDVIFRNYSQRQSTFSPNADQTKSLKLRAVKRMEKIAAGLSDATNNTARARLQTLDNYTSVSK